MDSKTIRVQDFESMLIDLEKEVKKFLSGIKHIMFSTNCFAYVDVKGWGPYATMISGARLVPTRKGKNSIIEVRIFVDDILQDHFAGVYNTPVNNQHYWMNIHSLPKQGMWDILSRVINRGEADDVVGKGAGAKEVYDIEYHYMVTVKESAAFESAEDCCHTIGKTKLGIMNEIGQLLGGTWGDKVSVIPDGTAYKKRT